MTAAARREAVRTAARIERALTRGASAERRAVMSGSYAPSGLVYLGVPVPHILRARGGSGDARRTAAALASDTDPMVAKALSWALRSLIPRDPAAVTAFLATHDHLLPALVRREVSRKLRTGRK